MEGPKKHAAHTRGHTPRLRLKSEEDMVQGKDDLSEIPCLVASVLPASRVIAMKNPTVSVKPKFGFTKPEYGNTEGSRK